MLLLGGIARIIHPTIQVIQCRPEPQPEPEPHLRSGRPDDSPLLVAVLVPQRRAGTVRLILARWYTGRFPSRRFFWTGPCGLGPTWTCDQSNRGASVVLGRSIGSNFTCFKRRLKSTGISFGWIEDTCPCVSSRLTQAVLDQVLDHAGSLDGLCMVLAFPHSC